MTTDGPLLILLQADDQQAAIARAEDSALADYDTVKVLDCQEGGSGVWTVQLAVSDRKAAEVVPVPRPVPGSPPSTKDG